PHGACPVTLSLAPAAGNKTTRRAVSSPMLTNRVRLWPGVVIVALQWLAQFVVPAIVPDWMMYGILIGAVGGGAAMLIWWLFFSRAPWAERIGAVLIMVVALVATKTIVHASIGNAGMGMMLYIFAIPVLCLALVVWSAMSRRLARGPRWAALVATVFAACAVFTLLRTGGITGEGESDIHWRWTQS